jgi:hypothetical protein
MGTIFQPVGGHNPVPEQKLYEVPLEEKTSVVVRWRGCGEAVAGVRLECALVNAGIYVATEFNDS